MKEMDEIQGMLAGLQTQWGEIQGMLSDNQRVPHTYRPPGREVPSFNLTVTPPSDTTQSRNLNIESVNLVPLPTQELRKVSYDSIPETISITSDSTGYLPLGDQSEGDQYHSSQFFPRKSYRDASSEHPNTLGRNDTENDSNALKPDPNVKRSSSISRAAKRVSEAGRNFTKRLFQKKETLRRPKSLGNQTPAIPEPYALPDNKVPRRRTLISRMFSKKSQTKQDVVMHLPTPSSSRRDSIVSSLTSEPELERNTLYRCQKQHLSHFYFISYRDFCDREKARILYHELNESLLEKYGMGYPKGFLDKKCLNDGENWKDGFLNALQKSKVIICLISTASVEKMYELQRLKMPDNVLIEIQTGLERHKKGLSKIIPVFIDFDHTIKLGKTEVDKTLYKLLRLNGPTLLPQNVPEGVPRIFKIVTDTYDGGYQLSRHPMCRGNYRHETEYPITIESSGIVTSFGQIDVMVVFINPFTFVYHIDDNNDHLGTLRERGISLIVNRFSPEKVFEYTRVNLNADIIVDLNDEEPKRVGTFGGYVITKDRIYHGRDDLAISWLNPYSFKTNTHFWTYDARCDAFLQIGSEDNALNSAIQGFRGVNYRSSGTVPKKFGIDNIMDVNCVGKYYDTEISEAGIVSHLGRNDALAVFINPFTFIFHWDQRNDRIWTLCEIGFFQVDSKLECYNEEQRKRQTRKKLGIKGSDLFFENDRHIGRFGNVVIENAKMLVPFEVDIMWLNQFTFVFYDPDPQLWTFDQRRNGYLQIGTWENAVSDAIQGNNHRLRTTHATPSVAVTYPNPVDFTPEQNKLSVDNEFEDSESIYSAHSEDNYSRHTINIKRMHALKSASALRSQKLNQYRGAIDIAYVHDLTDGMQSWLDDTRKNIMEIKRKINQWSPRTVLRFAFIGYRDFHATTNQPYYVVFDFDSAENILKKIKELWCGGGDDICDDLMGALAQVWTLDWKAKSRWVMVITDAPAHHQQFHDFEPEQDRFYNSCDPAGRSPKTAEDVMRFFANNDIKLHVFKIPYFDGLKLACRLEKMFSQLREMLARYNALLFVHDVSEDLDTFLPSALLSWASE